MRLGKSKWSSLLSVTVLVGTVLAGCGGGQATPSGEQTGGGQDQTQKSIKIGVLAPLTGAQADPGRSIKEGAELAAKHINESGGILGQPVEVVVRDTKGNPDTGVAAARELLGQGVNLQLGIVNSAVALAVSSLMEQENGIIITTAAHSDKLTHENFNKHYFRITDNPYMRERALAKLMSERYPDVTKWAAIIPDHEYGRSTWANFEAGLKAYNPNVEIVSVQKAPYGATDYKNFISAVLNSGAQGVFTSEYGGDAVTMYQQAAPYGFFDKIKVMVDSANEFLVPRAMGSNTPDHWVGSHWYYGAYVDKNPIAKKLYDDYVKTYNREPDGWVGDTYSAVLAYKAAIEKARSTDTAKVITALEGLTFDSPSGQRTIRAEDHQTIKDVNILHIVAKQGTPGWEVKEFKVYNGKDLIEPPAPGQPLKLN